MPRKVAIHHMLLELKNQFSTDREEIIDAIPVISSFFDTSRISDELIPFLTSISNFPIQLNAKCIRQIGKIKYSSFSEDQVKSVLDRIKCFSESESQEVRNAFIDCFVDICKDINPTFQSHIITSYISSFLSCKYSTFPQACGATIYSKLISYIKDDSRIFFSSFVDFANNSESSIVKQSIAEASSLLLDYDKDNFLIDLIMYYSADYSTSVVSAIPKFLVTYLSKTKDIKTTISIFQSLIISSDWRVRCITIKIFPDLFHIYKIPVSFFVSLYEHCIQDSEIEVKIAIVQQLKILINVPEAKEQLQNLLLNALSNDSPHIVTIAIQYALEMRNPTFITQNVIKLLRSQNVEIKLAAINALKTPSIPKEIIIQQMLHIINYSNDWRERESLVYLLTDLTFDVNEIIIKLLSDEAYKVRKSMVAQIPKLISKFGNEWAINHLMPFIKQTVKYEDYQIREVGAMALLCAELHHTKEGEKILDAFAKDPVGNVKIVIARNIEKGHPILQLLMKDDDEDVRLEASK